MIQTNNLIDDFVKELKDYCVSNLAKGTAVNIEIVLIANVNGKIITNRVIKSEGIAP